MAGWVVISLPLVAVLLSVLLSPSSNWTAPLALAGFCLLAFSRPAAALLVTMALVGFGVILSHMAGVPPLRATEVLVVASLAGCCLQAARRVSPLRHGLVAQISVPVALLGVAVVASTIVWQRVYQVGMEDPSTYFQTLFQFLIRDYFFDPGDFRLLVTTAVLLQGLALYVAVSALCRVDATFFQRSLRMLAVGGAGLGVLSAVRLGEILLRNPEAIPALRATAGGLRISPQIADYIAAGSYFALCWLVSLGLAIASRRRRVVWMTAGAPLIAALYLTGSRSVIAAALAGLVVLVFAAARRWSLALGRVVAFALVAIVVMVISYPWMTGRDIVGETAAISLKTRFELSRTTVRVIETRPLFGIGFDRYQLLADGLASPELNALWYGRKNPHNDVLRIGAELGVLGMGLFLWILVAAGSRIARAFQRAPDVRLAGLSGGLVAFVTTSMVSDPLMVREVSYAFWIALGLAVGRSAGPHVPREASGAPVAESVRRPRRRLMWTLALLVGGLLVLSVPFRARQELRSVDLRHVSYGFFDWGTDPDGTPNRWSGPRATFFVEGRARLVDIPLSGTLPSGGLQQVEVQVDGRLANRIAVGSEWQRLRISLPPGDSRAPRRVDLLISPTWVPAEVIGNDDRRVLGVKVGAINTITAADQSR